MILAHNRRAARSFEASSKKSMRMPKKNDNRGANASTAIPRVTSVEPERTKAVTYTVYEPNTPLPAVMKTWHVPADKSPDTPALTVLQTILSTGESSRLYESLVYRDQLAQEASAFLDTKKGTGNLIVYAILASGKSAADGDAALSREIAKLRDYPVTAVELAEAKNEILTSAIKSRETAEGRARIIASSVIIDGDPHAADEQLAAIQQVTPTDVQRVARQYLGADQSATIFYLPAESKPQGSLNSTHRYESCGQIQTSNRMSVLTCDGHELAGFAGAFYP